jgi:hypothetical protein
MEAIAPFIFSLFFIGVVILIIYGFIANQRRKKELRAYAQSKDLQFHTGIHRDFHRRFPEFSCLKQGHSRRGYNIIIGDYQNHPVVMFDYQYKTGSGKHQHTHSFSGVILDANLPLKPLVIRREHFFDKVGSLQQNFLR